MHCSTPGWATSTTGVGQSITTAQAAAAVAVQTVLGTQSTRTAAIPGAPTSSGQIIGAVNNVFNPPGRLTNLINTPGFNPAADQQTQAGVVDLISNGTTQVVAASDDAGDAITKEYLAANNNATQELDLPESAPTNLGEFFG